MTNQTVSKPWPEGVLQLFCPRVDDPKRQPVHGAQVHLCRDCGVEVVSSQRSRDYARETYPQLRLEVLCIECGVQYERPEIIVDDRGGDRKVIQP